MAAVLFSFVYEHYEGLTILGELVNIDGVSYVRGFEKDPDAISLKLNGQEVGIAGVDGLQMELMEYLG